MKIRDKGAETCTGSKEKAAEAGRSVVVRQTRGAGGPGSVRLCEPGEELGCHGRGGGMLPEGFQAERWRGLMMFKSYCD